MRKYPIAATAIFLLLLLGCWSRSASGRRAIIINHFDPLNSYGGNLADRWFK
jgi:hypothetical protein